MDEESLIPSRQRTALRGEVLARRLEPTALLIGDALDEIPF